MLAGVALNDALPGIGVEDDPWGLGDGLDQFSVCLPHRCGGWVGRGRRISSLRWWRSAPQWCATTPSAGDLAGQCLDAEFLARGLVCAARGERVPLTAVFTSAAVANRSFALTRAAVETSTARPPPVHQVLAIPPLSPSTTSVYGTSSSSRGTSATSESLA